MKKGNLTDLSERLCGVDDPALMARFLEEILTPAELEAVTLRWGICRLLLEGLPQREIARRLGVSLCKITRGAREMKRSDSVIRGLLETAQSTDAGSPCRPQGPAGPGPRSPLRSIRPPISTQRKKRP